MLSANLELNSKHYQASDKQIVKFTLTNNSDEILSVLKWGTPLEGINDDMFWVQKGEEVAVYLGRIMKRAAPRPEDYATLNPKESISTDFDLSNVYDISNSGNYTVEFDSHVLDIGTEEPKTLAENVARTGDSKSQKVRSNKVDFTLLEDRKAKQSRGVSLEWSQELSAEAFISSFRACSTQQRNLLKNALEEAEKMSNEALNALSNTSEDKRDRSARYLEWFGSYSAQNYDHATSNYNKIASTIKNKKIIFNCSMVDCGGDGVFAYVYPTRPFQIFLCGAFWKAGMTGTDSKPGTIIHELSHFDVLAGTDDNVYGQVKCRELAKRNPIEALVNADTHEYFAENSPPLEM